MYSFLILFTIKILRKFHLKKPYPYLAELALAGEGKAERLEEASRSTVAVSTR